MVGSVSKTLSSEPVLQGYDVDCRPYSDVIIVEARLLYCWPDGRIGPSWVVSFDPHPSTVFVHEPNWLNRWLGDTTEKRLARAKRSVSRWAEREIAKQERLAKAAKAAEL